MLRFRDPVPEPREPLVGGLVALRRLGAQAPVALRRERRRLAAAALVGVVGEAVAEPDYFPAKFFCGQNDAA